MRTEARAAVVRKAFVAGCERTRFRIIDWSLQGDHLHLIVEARDTSCLSRGMQGFCVRVARRLNAHIGRSGAVFAERYNARELKSPNEVRNARAYVMNNARRHDVQSGGELAPSGVDPFSSWAWFDGWRDCPSALLRKARAGPESESPVAEARTWLMKKGWRRHGLIRLEEIPGLRRSSRKP
jgi:REP element-mobilizing transposase RayT